MTDAAELQSILTAWAEMIEEVQPDRRSAVAIHARAAADRIRRLERVAAAAARLADSLASEATSTPLLELRTALQLLDARSNAGGTPDKRRDPRRDAL